MVYCTLDDMQDLPKNGDNFTLVSWEEVYSMCGFVDEPTHEQVAKSRVFVRPILNPKGVNNGKCPGSECSVHDRRDVEGDPPQVDG